MIVASRNREKERKWFHLSNVNVMLLVVVVTAVLKLIAAFLGRSFGFNSSEGCCQDHHLHLCDCIAVLEEGKVLWAHPHACGYMDRNFSICHTFRA